MKKRFRLIRRGERNTYYCFDTSTKKRVSLDTNDGDAAERIVEAKNDALRQPTLNLNIARAYLAGADSGFTTRTWRNALDSLIETKHGPTKDRWTRAAKDKALPPLLGRILAETQADLLLLSLHSLNYCVDIPLPWVYPVPDVVREIIGLRQIRLFPGCHGFENPSDTLLDDAAAAAACELVLQVSVWEYVLGIAGALPVARIYGADDSCACVRGHLAGCAWRAAFHSLNADFAAESGATSGKMAGQQGAGVSLALTTGQLASQAASLQVAMSGGRVLVDTSPDIELRAVSSWLWRSLVPERARDCARRRAKFLIRLLHGNSWADAARLAGFKDGAEASKVLAVRQTWAALARAQAQSASGHPIGARLAQAWARAARLEVKARRAARPYLHTRAC